MRLTDPAFEAKFIAVAHGKRNGTAPSFAEADAVRFRCPCGRGHWLDVGFAGRGDHRLSLVDGNDTTKHMYWAASGSSLSDLSLSPSVDVWRFKIKEDKSGVERDGSCWHGHIVSGEVRTC